MLKINIKFIVLNSGVKFVLSIVFTFLIQSNKLTNTQETKKSFETPRSSVVEITASNSDFVYPLFIKLPKSYSRNNKQKYPVVYLTDAWYAFQIISGATRYPMNIGKMQEVIIVGISYSKGSRGDSSRIYDYTPTINKDWEKPTGGADKFIEFVEQDVIAYMEKNYRTKPNDRTFVGNSLGGLLGSYILLTKPKLFKNYVIGSPSYWFDNEVIFQYTSSFEKHKIDIHARVFISIGERESKKLDSSYEMVSHAQRFYNKIQSWALPNLESKLLIIPQANHQTAFPTTAIQGLYWLFKL